MAFTGKIEGVSSDEIKRLNALIPQRQAEGLAALIEFYAADSETERAVADDKLKAAYRAAASARRRLDGLEDIRAEAQTKRRELADWLKILVAGKAV